MPADTTNVCFLPYPIHLAPLLLWYLTAASVVLAALLPPFELLHYSISFYAFDHYTTVLPDS